MMRRLGLNATAGWMLLVLLPATLAAPGAGRPRAGGDEGGPGDRKAAERAALTDARRQIAKHVMGLPISATAGVGDLVGAHTRIRAGFSAFIASVKPIGSPRWSRDGRRVEVVAQVKLADVYRHLKVLHQRHPAGRRAVTAEDFDRRIAAVAGQVVRRTGTAALAGERARPDQTPPLWRSRVKGEGVRAARQAAHTDAARKLLQRVRRLKINAGNSVRDFASSNRKIAGALGETCENARQQGVARFRSRELIVDVTLEVALAEVYTALGSLHRRHYKGARIKAGDFTARIAEVGADTLTATGSGVPPEKFLIGRSRKLTRPVTLRRPNWPKKIHASATSKVTGGGDRVGQAKLKALRRARNDARAELKRKLHQLPVAAGTSVGQFLAGRKGLAKEMEACLRAADAVSSKVYPNGDAVVVVEIETDRLWSIVSSRQGKPRVPVK